MESAKTDAYEIAFEAFRDYLVVRRRVAEAMGALGVETGNVDPHSNFAEVLVARELGGKIQPATNPGFDVLTADGDKVQVKSLRVASTNSGANGLDWHSSIHTRDGRLIDAHKLAVIIYLDHAPYCLIVFPVEDCNSFPAMNVKSLFISHAEKLLAGKYPGAEGIVNIVDLRGRGFVRVPDGSA